LYRVDSGAETQVQAQREFLRNSEQNLLLKAVQAYMDIYAGWRISNYRQQNLAALEEQVRADQARLELVKGRVPILRSPILSVLRRYLSYRRHVLM